MEDLLIIIGGVSSVISVAVFLASKLISTRLNESVKNEYAQSRELLKQDFQVQLQNLKNELLVDLEREKLKHAFIISRGEDAKNVISQITDHCYKVAHELAKLAIKEVSVSKEYVESETAKEKNMILLAFIDGSIWSEWRQDFQALRSKLEGSNEVISRYSVQMETILHSKTMKEIIDREFVSKSNKKIKHDDYRYILSSTWRLIGDCLSALGKVTTYDERFWLLPESKENYGRRLDEWVKLERENIVDTLKQFSSAKKLCEWETPEASPKDFIFYMKIEEDNGINEFWKFINESPKSGKG